MDADGPDAGALAAKHWTEFRKHTTRVVELALSAADVDCALVLAAAGALGFDIDAPFEAGAAALCARAAGDRARATVSTASGIPGTRRRPAI